MSGLVNITIFFGAVGACLAFVIMWMLNSESRIKYSRDEAGRLKSCLDSSEREKVALMEKLSLMESAAAADARNSQEQKESGAGENSALELLTKNEELEKENKQLKTELGEARASLIEVYKALS